MQLASMSTARYGGMLTVYLPEDHWAYRPDGEGGIAGLRMVTVGATRERFTALDDAIKAARIISGGARDAVAVVRDPGEGDDGPWRIERMLVKPMVGYDGKYRGIDLEGFARPGTGLVYQPLQSQRQVIVGAVVDGALLIDDIYRHTSSRPDLPGRDPDRPKG